MAVDVNKVQRAVAEVLAGINDGIADVSSIVSNVIANPPEKVVFQIEAVTVRDLFERVKIVEVPQKGIVTQIERKKSMKTTRSGFFLKFRVQNLLEVRLNHK